jgi:vacuolar-type H+-ATPase subunit I/STV1
MKIVTIKLDDEVYGELLKRAKEEGFLTVAEYVNSLILRTIEKSGKELSKEGGDEARKPISVERLLTVVERKVLDTMNPFTQKIDDISRKIAIVIERLEALEERVNGVEEKLKSLEKIPEEIPAKEAGAKKARKTAIEILKEQKVMLERDIASKIRDRDTFFAKLEREGAIVIEGKDERIAIDPQFWHQLLNKLKDIRTNNDEELKKILEPLEYKVVQKLRESALLVFDSSSKTWNLVM